MIKNICLALAMTFSLCAASSSKRCDVYFAPEHKLAQDLIELINQENDSLKIAVYKLTNRKIADAIIAAKRRRVDVEVVIDRVSCKADMPIHDIAKAGVPVFVFNPEKAGDNVRARSPHMYNRFCLFGHSKSSARSVWTGAFDFTYRSSKENRENVVLASIPTLVNKYSREFVSIKRDHSTTLTQYQREIALRESRAQKLLSLSE